MTEQFKLKEWSYSRQDIIMTTVPSLLPSHIESAQDGNYEFWKTQDITIEIGKFDNCREYGHTYALLNGKQDMVFCVYEHRNSDSIIINGCLRKDMQSYGPYNGGSKWDYLASFSYNEFEEATEKLAEFLLQAYTGDFDQSVLKPSEDNS